MPSPNSHNSNGMILSSSPNHPFSNLVENDNDDDVEEEEDDDEDYIKSIIAWEDGDLWYLDASLGWHKKF